MNIGGLQKNSLIDFPETICCVVFTQGCNFFCPYCHNPDLVAGPQKASGHLHDEKQILKFLETRKGLLDGVVITGGEPTLQKGLLGFCKKVKDMGFKLKLDTNGTGPLLLAQLFENQLLDYVAMDIKTSLDQYHLVTRQKKDLRKIETSISLIMDKAPAYEFRSTCIKPFIDKQILKKIAKLIENASLYMLQPCSKNVTVLNPEILESEDRFFSKAQLEKFKILMQPYVDECRIR